MKDEAKEAEGKSVKDRKKIKKATESLLWLKRGLAFTCQGLQNARKDKEQSLSASFQAAYSETLETYHGFITKKAIGVCIHFLQFIIRDETVVLFPVRVEGMSDSGDIVLETGRRGSHGICFRRRRSKQWFGEMVGGFRINCQAHPGLPRLREIRRRFRVGIFSIPLFCTSHLDTNLTMYYHDP